MTYWIVFGVGVCVGVLVGALAAGVFVWESAMAEAQRLRDRKDKEGRR